MANCPRCSAPVIQGYDHCTNCGLPFQPAQGQQPPKQAPAPQGQIPKQGAIPPQGAQPPQAQFQAPMGQGGVKAPVKSSPLPAPSFPYILAAKIDTQGFIWMITGLVQLGYGAATAISSFLRFINYSSTLRQLGANQGGANIYKQNQTLAIIALVASLIIAAIGFLNFSDGKKRKENAGWYIANPQNAMEEFSPLSAYTFSLVRNLVFLVILSLNIVSIWPIFMGLLGLIGQGFLLNIRYTVLKNAQP